MVMELGAWDHEIWDSFLQDEEVSSGGRKEEVTGIGCHESVFGTPYSSSINYGELVSPDLTTGHVGGFSRWTYWHEITSDVPGGDLHSMSRDSL